MPAQSSPDPLPPADGAPVRGARAHLLPDHAELAAHRDALLSRLGPGEGALLFAAPHHIRNGDAEYKYRQTSDLLYLTGWPDPEAAVLLRPGADPQVLMFVQARDPELETWTGRRLGPEGAVEVHGVDAAFAWDELAEQLPLLLQGLHTLHYRFAEDADRDRLIAASIAKARKLARRNGLDVPDAFIDPARLLHELRLRKTPHEIERLRAAGRITGEAHARAMAITRPGVFEYELESEIDHTFRRRGGSGPGYTTIVGGGDNATILHYITNSDPLQDGDLVCVDAGCELGGYTADVTRTWPVNGRFSAPQRELYELVLEAQLAAIDACRPGRRFLEVHEVATRALTRGMLRLGLLDGDPADEDRVDQLISEGAQKRYYMHGTSHWLGLDVHDAGVYNREGQSRPLEPGMVLTVEPGLYIPASDTRAPEAYRGIGIRIEDDVLVTDGEPDVLTAGIPKTVAEVEAAVGAAAR